MNKIILYMKPTCPLCDEVKNIIELLETEYNLDVHEVNIESDEKLMETYVFEIPVLLINGEELDYRSIDYLTLRERLH